MKASMKIGKNISVLSRLSARFYDRQLASHGIGCGQQFFLFEIAQAPGITLQALAQTGHYDNGSATRATQKLEADGYLRIETDSADKRIRRYYITDEAEALLKATRIAKREWHKILMKGFSDEEAELANKLLARMAENACRYSDHAEIEVREQE